MEAAGGRDCLGLPGVCLGVLANLSLVGYYRRNLEVAHVGRVSSLASTLARAGNQVLVGSWIYAKTIGVLIFG